MLGMTPLKERINIMLKYLNIREAFVLESGFEFPKLQIAYHTYGTLSPQKDNVVWVCHALTANSDAEDWWSGLVGKGKLYDPEHYYIVCANILGSPYGSTGPLSKDENGQTYYLNFPSISVRDMVKAHTLLRQALKIEKIHTVLGGSIGSFQAIEWSIMEANRIENLIIIAGSAKASPWVVALNETQRMAIEADKSFFENKEEGGLQGMKAARAIALLSYRNQQAYNHTQNISNDEDYHTLKAISYQQYQGEKLAQRFNAYSYYYLSKAVDSHNVGRGRQSLSNALKRISAKTLIIGIESDILFPPYDQELMHKYIEGSSLQMIDSLYGHDGFLLEHDKIEKTINAFYKS
jgi:homoserine O-acetyltransferase